MKKILIIIGVLTTGAVLLYASVTPNMNMTLPTVGTTVGPTWASQLNAALEVVDAHDHSPGKGALISNAGISSSASIARSKLALGGASYVVVNDTDGVMSGEATLGTARGGTGLSNYASGDILYASGTNVLSRLAKGAIGTTLRISGSSLPAWQSADAQQITTQTTTYQILNTDDVILANAAGSFTMTLPDCASNSGKAFKIKKIDSDYTRIVTITRAGSDTIQDATSAVTSTSLNTQGEEIDIVSSGSTVWQIVNRRIPSVFTAYTPSTNGMGTISSNASFWRRNGDSIEVSVSFVTGTVTANEARVNLPTGLTIDNTKNSGTRMVGTWMKNAVQASSWQTVVIGVGNSAYFNFAVNGTLTAGYTLGNGNDYFTNSTATSFFATVPVTGWNG